MTFGAVGERCWVEEKVTDGHRVPGAPAEIWEADEDGLYDVQYTCRYQDSKAQDPEHARRPRCPTPRIDN